MTNPAPVISVVIPAYNAEKYLVQSVESILTQTFTDFELLIIDDGSTDKTLEIANGFTDPRIRVIKNPHNLGIPKTRNIGWQEAGGDFIANQDADDWSHPERLEKQLAFMHENPQVAMSSTNRNLVDEHGNSQSQRAMPASPTWVSMKMRNEIVCTSVMIRKSILDEFGGYNECFDMAEDYELWLRIIKKHPIANMPEHLINIRVHSQSTTAKDSYALVNWHTLAKAVTCNLVTQANVKRYYENGIETFFPEIPQELKAENLVLLAAGFKNTKRYKEAHAKYIELKNLNGWNWKIGRNIFKMWIKSR